MIAPSWQKVLDARRLLIEHSDPLFKMMSARVEHRQAKILFDTFRIDPEAPDNLPTYVKELMLDYVMLDVNRGLGSIAEKLRRTLLDRKSADMLDVLDRFIGSRLSYGVVTDEGDGAMTVVYDELLKQSYIPESLFEEK